MELRIRALWAAPSVLRTPRVRAPRVLNAALRRGIMRVIMLRLLPAAPRAYPTISLPTSDAAIRPHGKVFITTKIIPLGAAPSLPRARLGL